MDLSVNTAINKIVLNVQISPINVVEHSAYLKFGARTLAPIVGVFSIIPGVPGNVVVKRNILLQDNRNKMDVRLL